jgi:hypothetical protein
LFLLRQTVMITWYWCQICFLLFLYKLLMLLNFENFHRILYANWLKQLCLYLGCWEYSKEEWYK